MLDRDLLRNTNLRMVEIATIGAQGRQAAEEWLTGRSKPVQHDGQHDVDLSFPKATHRANQETDSDQDHQTAIPRGLMR